MAAAPKLPFTGDPVADRLLERDPLALLFGMLLDQQVPIEWAFKSPSVLKERLGSLDAGAIAAMPVDDFVAIFVEKPALHRYPASMAKRAHQLCEFIVEHYRGDPKRIWKGVTDPAELHRRIRELPGFGDDKAQIFLAILGKRLGLAPAGWEPYAGRFGDDNKRSAADIDSHETLLEVRAFKKAMKAQAKEKVGK
jgi:uncharacterized HhH-GPD family protein